MELQFIMDGAAEALSGTMWFPNTPSPPYEQLSPVRQNRCDAIAAQQTPMGYQSPPNSIWQEKHCSPKGSSEGGVQMRTNSDSPQHLSPPSGANIQQNGLKRKAAEPQEPIEQQEKKRIRRDGSVGSNGSAAGQGWSTQVEELAEHLAADFDGSLSALAASDLATAVASYNMSEALLSLPSLTVFKQEAPSPENQHNNQTLNHVSQRTINSAPTNNGNVGSVEADSNNNGQTAASLHQLLYSSNEEYPPTSSSGNQVSSSQQGSELNEDCRFQYVLAAATSIATKVNEETLTYLNQGQSYEIKLKKLGDLSAYRGKILKVLHDETVRAHANDSLARAEAIAFHCRGNLLSQIAGEWKDGKWVCWHDLAGPQRSKDSTIRICFHERRLQYTEKEQMLAWQRARPGERLLEMDVPLSYGMVDVCQHSVSNNSVEFMWDPTKEVGVYIKVNCISTEFTPKKHGGEKGVPFRIHVETRLPGGPRLHAASCQVKVFKLKGADRKHKQDRDKILRRPPHEQDKYQPSYDCTVLSDIPLESLPSPPNPLGGQNGPNPYTSIEPISSETRATVNGSSSPVLAPLPPLSAANSNVVPLVSTPDLKENEGTAPALPSPAAILPDQSCITAEVSTCMTQLPADANATQTSSWLRASRFNTFESTFASFSAADILRLSRDDLIQICGLADGIRLFNALHSPKLTLYFSLEGNASLWRVAYLENLTSSALMTKLLDTLNLPPHDRLHSVLFLGPQGIHVLVTDELVANMKDESMYLVETIKDNASERYKLLLKPSTRS